MRWRRARVMPVTRFRWLLWGFLAFLSACAFVPHQTEWIAVGHTTRQEVIDAYGEPDFVMASVEGETVVYRSVNVNPTLPPLEIPTAQVGPRGMMATKLEPINRGPSHTAMPPALRKRPDRDLRIRYDTHGVVREIIQ